MPHPIPPTRQATRRPHVVVKSWRDHWHPDAGGAEVWLDEVTRRLAATWDVTVLTQRDPGRPDREVVDGVSWVRRGGTHSQYLLAHLSQRRLPRSPDVVLDVFNGVPFLSALQRRRPVAVVVHHVHREQWHLVFGPVIGRIGWLLERAAARLQAGRRHVTVSGPSAEAIATTYRVPAERITVAHNGVLQPASRTPATDLVAADRRVVVLGRLVPHKRVELAVDAVAAAAAGGLDVHLEIVGSGEWRDQLADHVSWVGADRLVTLHGHVDAPRRDAILAAADVLALPSVREGWGLVVGEAAQHGVPTVAMASAGGTIESVGHEVGGLLAADDAEFERHLLSLLVDNDLRARLGAGARRAARRFTWEQAAARVDGALRATAADDGIDLPGTPLSGTASTAWGPLQWGPTHGVAGSQKTPKAHASSTTTTTTASTSSQMSARFSSR